MDVQTVTKEKHWTETDEFKRSLDSRLFYEKFECDKPEDVASAVPERTNGNSPVLGANSSDFEYYVKRQQLEGRCSGSAMLYDLLSGVHTTDLGKHIVPQKLQRGRLEKVARHLSMGYANLITSVAFDFRTDDPVADRSYQKKLNKYQKQREDIRRNIAADIAYAFPVSRLLVSNPLREEGGKDMFTNFCRSRALKYLADLIRSKEPKVRRSERAYRTKRYRRDDESLNKPLRNSCDTYAIDLFLREQRAKKAAKQRKLEAAPNL
jgi:hypothetical protein